MEVRPDEVVSLNGGALDLHSLELIIQIANRNGKVAIINMGHSSIFDLGMALLKMAESQKPRLIPMAMR
jgi:hypothetical protein